MNRVISTLLFVAMIVAVASAAHAASPFAMSATNTGLNEWTYTVANNDDVYRIFSWTLHWNPSDIIDDAAKAAANYDRYANLFSARPSGWMLDLIQYPSETVLNTMLAIGPHQSLGGFVIKYGTSANPNPVSPAWFSIGYLDANSDQHISEAVAISGATIPEPSAMVSLLSAIGCCGFAFRKRLAR